MMKKKFQATLQKDDKTQGTAVAMPFDVKEVFGARARVPVRGTINGATFRSTLSPYGGVHYLPVNRQLREAAKAAAGDIVEIVLDRDDEPRVIEAPDDFAKALKRNRPAQEAWDKLSYSHRREYVGAIEEARKPETRRRRIEGTVAVLAKGAR